MTDRLLPPNASVQEVALEQATARVETLPVPLRDVWNPDTCPDGVLPWLAWAFGVDYWDASWTPEAKRAAIKNSLAVKRTKGTPYSVRTAISALFNGARFTEWHNELPRAAEYTFRLELEVTTEPLDETLLQRVVRIAQYTKNLRSHLTSIAVSTRSTSTLRVAAVAGFGVELTVGPDNGFSRPLILDGSWSLDGSERLDGVTNG